MLCGLRLPARGETLQPELPYRLQHRESFRVRAHFRTDQALLHQGGERREDVRRPVVERGPDRFRRFERATAREHRQPAEEQLLVGGEQIVAPVNRAAHGLLARRQIVRTIGEER